MKTGISLNIKKYLKSLVNAFRGMFTAIPVTFCVIIVMNVFIHLLMVLSEHGNIFTENAGVIVRSFVSYMAVLSAFTAVGTLFTEIALVGLHNSASRNEPRDISENGHPNTFRSSPDVPSPLIRIFGTLISTTVAVFISYKMCGYFFITADRLLLDIDSFTERTALCTAGYVITLLSIALYFCVEKSRLSFYEYAMRIFVKFFQIYIVSVVLLVGMALITFIITELFFSSGSGTEAAWEVYGHLAALVGGIYALLFSVYAFIEPECDVSRFMEILVKYVLHILSLIAYVIIYIYMLKILILREIPSNSVFEICTALFVSSMIIAIMCLSFEIKGFLQKAAKLLPYIFTPFIVLQIYSAGARIRQYGLTPQRYIGVVFIVFEIIYIIIYAVSNAKTSKQHSELIENSDEIDNEVHEANSRAKLLPKMHHIFLVIAMLTAFSAFMPGLNVLTASKNSQVRAIKQYLFDKEAASNELLKKANGAIFYIRESDYGKDYLKKIFSEDELYELSSRTAKISEDDTDIHKNFLTIYGPQKLDFLDIQAYGMLYLYDGKAELKSNKPDDLSDVRIVLTDENDEAIKSFSCNFKPLYDEYIAIDEDKMTNVFIDGNNCVELSDGSLLYMTTMSLQLTTYMPVNSTDLYGQEPEIDSLYIHGYILEK